MCLHITIIFMSIRATCVPNMYSVARSVLIVALCCFCYPMVAWRRLLSKQRVPLLLLRFYFLYYSIFVPVCYKEYCVVKIKHKERFFGLTGL